MAVKAMYVFEIRKSYHFHPTLSLNKQVGKVT